MRNRNQKGFTLIELLIVIAIIGILAAVLIPNLLSARARAQDSAAQACASELLTQAEIWNIDNATYEGFTGLNAGYVPNSCGDQISSFNVGTADGTDVAGTVISMSTQVFSWSNSAGIVRGGAAGGSGPAGSGG